MIGSQVEAQAADGQLTVGELREFVNALERAEVPGSAVIRGRVTWRGAIRSLSASTSGGSAATPWGRQPAPGPATSEAGTG